MKSGTWLAAQLNSQFASKNLWELLEKEQLWKVLLENSHVCSIIDGEKSHLEHCGIHLKLLYNITFKAKLLALRTN